MIFNILYHSRVFSGQASNVKLIENSQNKTKRMMFLAQVILTISTTMQESYSQGLLIEFDNIIMGSHLCPASKKDLIQNFSDIEKGEKSYESILKGCLSSQPLENPDHNQRDISSHEFLLEAPSGSKMSLESHSNKNLRVNQECQRESSLVQNNWQNQQVHTVIVADLLLEDGWKYSGQTLRGLPEGQGEEFGPNGDHYVGSFKNGQKNGYGTYHFANSAIYRGQFKQNVMWGSGVFQFPNGDRFQGHFVNNMRQGKGRYTPRQPNIQGMLYFEGEYKNDLKNGPGMIRYQNEEVQGVWKDGCYEYSFHN